MQKIDKKLSMAIGIFLVLAISTSMFLLPSTEARQPGWTWVSYPYLTASPNPVGVGQTVAIVMWIDAPLPGAAIPNNIRRHDYTLTITNPDGKNETQHWDAISDTTSVQYIQYTPNKAGNYTLTFSYPDQKYTWNQANTPGLAAASAIYENDTFLGASKTINLEVQEEAVPQPIDSYPLPTEYWARPIEGQNTWWYTIASNWLGTPYVLGAGAGYGIPGAVQPDGAAPNSAHVMWAKPIQWGGVVGGTNTSVLGESFYGGLSYNCRFANPIIMQGTLYYQEPWGNSAGGGDYVAVNLQTGKELWRINASATGVSLVPSFGYIYSAETPNQHGVLPNGLLIAVSGTTWRAYDARTGVLTTMVINNVPAGTNVAGPSGEILRYTLTNLGTTAAPKYYLTQWNSSRVFGGASGIAVGNWYTGTVAANVSTAYDWNVSLPLTTAGWTIGTAGQGSIPLIAPGNTMLLTQGGFGGHPGDFAVTVTADNGNITAISLKPETLGNISWSQSYAPAPGNNSRVITDWDVTNGVFVFEDKESIKHYGYSLTDGKQLWEAPAPTDTTIDYNFMAQCLERIAYGKLYVSGYAGVIYCYDVKTGDLLWSYGNGGEGNSTLSGFVTPYGRYPLFISTIADGKVYTTTTEHSPNAPLYKDAKMRALNATTGAEIWTLTDYGNQMYGGQSPIADGYLTTLNSYDGRIYSIGKGPSALTVTAPDVAAASGTPIVIRGTITDIAAGTTQDEQAARFPNGVPAVSDASQGAWMEYVYMQKPKPTDITGVPITLSVIDSNNNSRNIGMVTSDASGMFTLTWTPDIEGSYTVVANFAGSNSYYPSSSESSFAVQAAVPTPTSQPQIALPPTEMYILAMGIAIIAALAIATLLILKKR
jgi:hypothetical protein